MGKHFSTILALSYCIYIHHVYVTIPELQIPAYMEHDIWTRSTTGCPCLYNTNSTDCACCHEGGCQCPENERYQCVRCGFTESHCGLREYYRAISCTMCCFTCLHWNGNVVSLTFSSLDALKVVKMTISSAYSGENFLKMTTEACTRCGHFDDFQCIQWRKISVWIWLCYVVFHVQIFFDVEGDFHCCMVCIIFFLLLLGVITRACLN